MLPFGSIWSQLPLLIFGGMYMLYLGFVAVSKSREAIEINDSQQEEHSILIKGNNPPDLFSLAKQSSTPEDAVIKVSTGFIPLYLTRNFNFLTDDAWHEINQGDFTLFSRPPPEVI